MTKEIILIGGGGHCRSCIDVIESIGTYKIAGIIDPSPENDNILGYPIIGADSDLGNIRSKYSVALITVGQVGSSNLRQNLFKLVNSLDFHLPAIISPLAHISTHSFIGAGTIVMHHVNVNANVRIGMNCILNNKCLIEHDVVVGDHTHISTAAVVNGSASVGTGVFVGSNATVVNGATLSENLFFKANSLIKTDSDGREII